jgi:hypothetical protein
MRSLHVIASLVILATAVIIAPPAALAGAPHHSVVTGETNAPNADSARLLARPNGCPSGFFCVYRNGNGGDLCLANSGNNANWGAGCANDGETLFNNGVPDPYDKVRMYWGSSYYGAWGCLTRGSYWLYATRNYFDYGAGKAGFGQQVGNNAVSHKWAQSCG